MSDPPVEYLGKCNLNSIPILFPHPYNYVHVHTIIMQVNRSLNYIQIGGHCILQARFSLTFRY